MQHLGGVGWGGVRQGGVWEHQATQGDDVTPSGAVMGSLMATGGRLKHSVCVCMHVCMYVYVSEVL